jgi:hypothetical protein
MSEMEIFQHLTTQSSAEIQFQHLRLGELLCLIVLRFTRNVIHRQLGLAFSRINHQ